MEDLQDRLARTWQPTEPSLSVRSRPIHQLLPSRGSLVWCEQFDIVVVGSTKTPNHADVLDMHVSLSSASTFHPRRHYRSWVAAMTHAVLVPSNAPRGLAELQMVSMRARCQCMCLMRNSLVVCALLVCLFHHSACESTSPRSKY